MAIPTVQGVIERRLLINFRADPAVVARMLPAPFEPVTVGGYAIVGICLIRLASVRPRFVPSVCGIRSENAAHRIAVCWSSGGRAQEGVYIPRRDTSSRINTFLGGRLFPGVHRRAEFRVSEPDDRYDIEIVSHDGAADVSVGARAALEWPAGSIFEGIDGASEFFQRGALGFSQTRHPGVLEGLELRCEKWCVGALAVESVRSSFFENRNLFPAGSVEFDCALVMRDIAHEWRGLEPMCCATAAIPGHAA